MRSVQLANEIPAAGDSNAVLLSLLLKPNWMQLVLQSGDTLSDCTELICGEHRIYLPEFDPRSSACAMQQLLRQLMRVDWVSLSEQLSSPLNIETRAAMTTCQLH